ncbi:MAG TPA: segregation/condensation protein A [Clostridia bacterium]|jgi:segregation and condensation protein A|nr:segregation/condensation protein A [Clostridia bacterium]
MENNIDYTAKQTSPLSYHLYNEDVPLDVLLSMCSKEEVAIEDIFVSDITRQFIDYVSSLKDKNYEEISSFLLLAATLLELKSSRLLPKIEFDELEDGFIISDEKLFELRAENYLVYKEAAGKLAKTEILNRFYREPEYDEKEYNLIIKNFDVNKMISAFSTLLEVIEFTEDSNVIKKIPTERFKVSDRIKFILEYMEVYKTAKFVDFIEPDFSKVEVINTFLAVLELCKEQFLSVSQEENDKIESIWLHLNKDADAHKINSLKEILLKNVDEYN